MNTSLQSDSCPLDVGKMEMGSWYTAQMKRLIINADDFGLAPGVNRAIVELESRGALSSTTLMATAPYFSPAVHMAFEQPRLAVGCHVVLVDGAPCLPPREVPSLLDPKNGSAFRVSAGSFVASVLRGSVREQEVEAEAIAQIRRIQQSGLTVSHIDSHKHMHALPRVLAPLLRAASHCGVRCVRNPFEPRWSLKATKPAGGLRRLQVHAMRTQEKAFQKLVKDHGMVSSDGSLGLLATGILNGPILRSLLEAMPDGTWELVCHPGYRDQVLNEVRTRLRTERETEREALLEVIPEAVEKDTGLALVDYHQLGTLA
jgi:chitin disaccharide deacetylase